MAQLAQQSSAVLSVASHDVRSRVILAIAEAIAHRQDDILEANTLDLEVSREMAVPELLIDWLKLTPERLQLTSQLLRQLSEAPDPLFTTERVAESVVTCEAYGIRKPLGTVAFVYEAFPELTAIAAGFCIRTGNVLLLRGGSEASSSNQMFATVIQAVLDEMDLPQGCLQLIPADEGETLRDLLTLEDYVDLAIPYGRSSLVQKVVKQATVPVVKTAMGNCYLFWSLTGAVEQVQHMIVDSHQSEPDPVNAIDHVLIHRGCNYGSIAALFGDLRSSGFKLKGGPDLSDKIPGIDPVKDSDWHHASLNQTIVFRFVDSLDDAVSWINRHSSGHADVIVTDSYSESREFVTQITSTHVYVNTSPRFYRYHPKTGGMVLAMTHQSNQNQGLVDFNSLTTIQRVVQGR
ncbi:MAG: gamma-glutamyl-phosphate reductase [Leptolyngbyaceae bacterium]|nr:gamma-glutamyl-phosphate reductase [Leptolyngbyaceae bacterium]